MRCRAPPRPVGAIAVAQMTRLQLGLAHRPHALDPIAEEPQGQARRVDVAAHRRTATLHAAELHLAYLAEPPVAQQLSQTRAQSSTSELSERL